MSVDLARVEGFLTERYGSDWGNIAPVGAGEWSKAFSFQRVGKDYVVRFGAHREDFAKDRFAGRWASPALPIPRVIELGEALGTYYCISERVPGSYIDAAGGAEMRALLPALLAALDAMRLADLSGTTGCGPWDAGGNAPYPTWQAALLAVAGDHPALRIHGWRQRLADSPAGSGPFDEAYRHLQRLARGLPAGLPGMRCLIHSDLLHYNVLVEGNRITGVLDWGCGMYGDFLYDLAWLCFWQPWYPVWRDIDFEEEARRHYAASGLEVPLFEERLRCCLIHIGLAGMAYQAYAGLWTDLQATAERTLEVA